MNFQYQEKLASGRRSMAHLIHVWHERNGWSHKVLPALVDTLNLGKVHNSQISNLRNGKLASPSPEVFLALSQANIFLDKGLEEIRFVLERDNPDLLRVLEESAIPLKDDQEKVLVAGDFFEIFIGTKRLPVKFDWFIRDEEAIKLSASISDIFCNNLPWRYCKSRVMSAYPISSDNRRNKFAAVMAGLRDYSAEELDGELIDLYKTYKSLYSLSDFGLDQFLALIRKTGQNLNNN